MSKPPPQAGAASPAQNIARLLLALLLTGLGAWTLREFIPALVWACILAIAVWPLFERARRRLRPGKHNLLLPSLFTLVIGGAFIIPLVMAALQAVRESHVIFDWVETARRAGIPAPGWLALLPMGADQATAWWNENLADPEAAAELLRRVDRTELVGASRQIGASVAHRALLFGFSLTTLFFLFKDGDALTIQLQRASHRAFGPSGERIGRQIIASIHGTVDGLVLVGIGEGVVLGIVYAFAGVPHPTLFGAVTAVAAMIPLAAPVVFAIAALLLVGQDATMAAVAVFATGMIVTFVADHFIRPVLIGGATKLPFLWVLFGILGGVTTWGLLGLFLGPAIMAALILLWREWTSGSAQR